MEKLNLLFAKDSLTAQILKGKTVQDERIFFADENAGENFFQTSLAQIFPGKNFTAVTVISALNHFTLLPQGFSDHASALNLISYNAPVENGNEELMLSINPKFGIQFYYTFPLDIYRDLKSRSADVRFNFSGEKFLNSISVKDRKEIHINLYHQQCEFFALHNKRMILYNNLDVDSEVDFLYFVMFTLSKIGFGTGDTHFFVYGETSENETFISELRKFVRHLKISFDNLPKKNFILA